MVLVRSSHMVRALENQRWKLHLPKKLHLLKLHLPKQPRLLKRHLLERPHLKLLRRKRLRLRRLMRLYLPQTKLSE